LAEPAPSQRGPSVRTAVTVVIVGAVLGLFPAFKVVSALGGSAFRAAFATAYPTPADRSLNLKEGRYLLFEHVGHTKGKSVGPVFVNNTNYDRPVIAPQLVSIHDASGEPVPVGPYRSSGSETITRHNDIYGATLEFRVPHPGTYTVQVDAPKPTTFIISRGIGDSFGKVAGWFALGFGCGLVVLLGFALLAIGGVRRRRAAAPPRTPGEIWPPPRASG
jgi:hypothetical protein